MTQTKLIHQASFKVRAKAFPGRDWSEYCKAFDTRRAVRRTSLTWNRIDGAGFTIWPSDVILLDSRTTPPTWSIRLEALASLNPAGQQRWQEVCQGIERFFFQVGLDLEPGE